MPSDQRFHHIGLLVHDIRAARARLQGLGYTEASPPYRDDRQGIVIVFVDAPKSDWPRIELVEPVGEDSVVRDLLTRNGAGLYHFCFEVPDLQASIDSMSHDGYRPLDAPHPSPAFAGRLFVFLYHRDVGLIELVETP